ncbi:MAG: D-lactate dehydrogenase VanH-E [Lachnospiraceae bacterium]|nr:D-lactate dehydrogenase VanH-E [Lachnospiraceae bacterium]
MKITVFDCEEDETELFHELSPHFGIEPVMTKLPAAKYEHNPELLNACISVGHKSRITGADLLALKESGVKYITTRSIGYDHIDTDAASRLGITVSNTVYSPDGVADYTLMLILMAIRGIKSSILRAEHSDFRLNCHRGKELCDMTVGIIGAGRIGRAVQNRLHGFGCRILLCDQNHGADCIPLCELLQKSDIITLHVPLSADTYHMLGRDQLHCVKRGAFLINTGRGALVDTQELINALEDGRLGGAALDVMEEEEGIFYSDCSHRTIRNPFLPKLQKMPNVIITPHTAYYTDRVLYDTVEITLRNCFEFERRQTHG